MNDQERTAAGPRADVEAPADDTPLEPDATGTEQSAENTCPRCAGSGRRAGEPCPACDGTGLVTEVVGDA